jgi:hypothetical protein
MQNTTRADASRYGHDSSLSAHFDKGMALYRGFTPFIIVDLLLEYFFAP